MQSQTFIEANGTASGGKNATSKGTDNSLTGYCSDYFFTLHWAIASNTEKREWFWNSLLNVKCGIYSSRLAKIAETKI